MKLARKLGKAMAGVAILLIRFYQYALSPLKYVLFGPNSGCRFQPTCSNYGLQCFRSMPFGRALRLTAKRVLSCHPWGGSGYDPVPSGERITERENTKSPKAEI